MRSHETILHRKRAMAQSPGQPTLRPTASAVGLLGLLSPGWGSPIVPSVRPSSDYRSDPRRSCGLGKEVDPMRLVKRLAVAAGSLLALVLAGGAHVKF